MRALAPEVRLNFLDRFLNSKPPLTSRPVPEDQAVLIYCEGEDLEASIPLQEKLIALLEDQQVGMFDGNEVGNGELVLFLYGPDAELLFKFIEPILRADDFCRGARIIIRWGGPNAPKREVTI